MAAAQGARVPMGRNDRSMLARLTIATLLAAGTAGCAVSPLTISRPYPVTGNPVNPTPTPEYRVVCSTGYGPTILFFSARTTHCSQEYAPAVARDVVSVRG